ncbi:MAG TPA: MoaD/ThiS family protein [Chthoniobacterales bacterium]
MLIKIQYFSLLRDLKGPDSVEISEGSTVADLLKTLFAQVPGLEAWNKRLLIAAGIEWVPQNYIVRPDDVISLMPPVQGG